MIVVDTNIIGYLYLESPHSPQVERALLKDPNWAAPLLWRSEFRNVLAAYLRRRWLSLAESQQIMSEALGFMEGQEYEAASDQVLELVSGSSCSAYNCEFVALAQDLKLPLVTTDKQVLRDFPKTAVSLSAFAGEAEAGDSP